MNISKEIRAKEKHKEGEKEKGGEKERPKEGGRCTKKESEGGGRKWKQNPYSHTTSKLH